jgi:hypothetical protein
LDEFVNVRFSPKKDSWKRRLGEGLPEPQNLPDRIENALKAMA